MRARLSRYRPSPAMAVALLALVVALGATAEGAVIITSNSQVARGTISGGVPPSGDHSNIIAGSIGGNDLHATSVGTSELVPNAVTSDKIRNGGVHVEDLSAEALGAEAYANVLPNDEVDSAKNVLQADSPTTGVFCLQLFNVPPTRPAVATPDGAHASTRPGTDMPETVVEVNPTAPNCSGEPLPEIEVDTWVRTWTIANGKVTHTVLTPSPEGFMFVMG
jgi:hypothetical protein